MCLGYQQDTLAFATAMLTEATDNLSDMEVGAAGSGTGCVDNEDTLSSRSKSLSPVIFNAETVEDYDSVDKQL